MFQTIGVCGTGNMGRAIVKGLVAAKAIAADHIYLYNIHREKAESFSNFGRHIGNAFQITDDIIDYISTESAMGKNPGDDFMEGKITLPAICACCTSDSRLNCRFTHSLV